jgi:hypothetical protein
VFIRGLEIDRRESFTGKTMTIFGSMTSNQQIGSRLARLPLVVLVTIGLLLSLLHCTDSALSFAKTDSVGMTMPAKQGSTPDMPEHLLPCHSGHCLSHVTAQQVMATAVPADQAVRLPAFGREQFPAAIAGLPLFKPPRV